MFCRRKTTPRRTSPPAETHAQTHATRKDPAETPAPAAKMTCKCKDCDCGADCKCCECCSGGKCTCPPGECKCCSSGKGCGCSKGGKCTCPPGKCTCKSGCCSSTSETVKARLVDNLPVVLMVLGAGVLVGYALGSSSSSK